MSSRCRRLLIVSRARPSSLRRAAPFIRRVLTLSGAILRYPVLSGLVGFSKFPNRVKSLKLIAFLSFSCHFYMIKTQ
tara:strand:- start:26778 stop:27008 length:231 start_codon:yes stop_codon:yes gene_type:complete